MKRLLLIWALFLCSLTAAFAQFSGSGSGTKDDPYLIFYAEQLSQVRNFLGKDSVYFKLMSDIDLTNWIEENNPEQGWQPIGGGSSHFKGIFIGNHHSISGLKINRSSENIVGLFGYLENATITDLILSDAIIEGKESVGVVAGRVVNSNFKNITITSSCLKSSADYAGGMIGSAENCTFEDIQYEGNIESSSNNIGGIVGFAKKSNFANCYNSSNITGGRAIGGIIGQGYEVFIINVKATGNIKQGDYLGGIIGYARAKCSIKNAYYKGEISGTERLGGIVGYIPSEGEVAIDSCWSWGEVKGTSDYVGGIVGISEGGSLKEITKCNHFGDISGKCYVGGIIGNVKFIGYQNNNMTLQTYSLTIRNWQPASHDQDGNWYPGHYIYHTENVSDNVVQEGNKYVKLSNNSVISNITADSYVGGIIGYDLGGSGSWISTTNPSFYEAYRTTNGVKEPVSQVNLTTYHQGSYSSITENNIFSGEISGRYNLGGIIGKKYCGIIRKNFSNASINGTDSIGGIVGSAIGSNTDNYNNPIEIKSNVCCAKSLIAAIDNVGGVYGLGQITKTGDYGTNEENRLMSTARIVKAGITQTISDNLQNGTKTGPSSLKLKANYVSIGWDFNNDWTIQETETYPYKPWQAAPPKITSNLVSQETTISGKSIDGGTVYIEVGDSYKSSVVCSGNQWSFSVPALQSGDPVRLYAVVDGKGQSPYTDATVNYPGSGTEADPYRVYTAADLQGVYKKGYYKLMNDIDLTEWINKYSPTEGWPAIGKNGVTAVYFDGAGHKITGLWCNTTAGYNGLFSNFPAGYIKNLTVETASGKSVKGGDYTAVLIGRMTNGKIENVTVKGNAEGSNHVGGITGMTSEMKFNNVNYEGETISSSTKDIYIGGLAGLADGSVDVISSYAKVKLTTTGSNANAGGIFGKGSNVILKNSHAETTAKTSGDSTFVGGLVGVTEATDSITKCYSEGTLSATGAKSYVGGLVGINKSEGLIENCYSIADATSTLYAAGLVAYNYGKVSNSYSKGNVNSEFYGAGVVGYNDGAKATVNNLVAGNPQVNVTDKSGWSIRVLGGFKNGAAQPGENNYALSTMILSVNGVPKKVTDNILDGYAKTEDELKSEATYEKLGWSFSRVWKIEEGKAWPTLDMTVYGLVTSVILDQKTLTLKKGQTATLRATVKPDDATNKTVAWSSSDTSIATVKDGVVRGVGNGKATIIATSTDGTNLADSAIVTVYAPVNDTIVLKDTTTLKNKTIMYPVYLNNEDPVCSFQFDVYLPDGIDIAKNSKGKYDIQFAGRQEDTHSITSRKQKDGAIRIVAFSVANDNFSGNSGALVTLPLVIGDVAQGDYMISIRNIVLADKAEKEFYCADAQGSIHVNNVLRGDANSDGKVSLADVNSTVNYIVGDPSESFSFAAADMNDNGIVNVSDVNAIVNVILGGESTASGAKSLISNVAKANEVTTSDKMYCSDVHIAPGGTATLPVNLDNNGKYCSFQFDIILPDGITVANSIGKNGKVKYEASIVTDRCTDHTLASNLLKGNRYRVVVFSLTNTDLEGTSGPVVNITLKADDTLKEGKLNLKMEGVVLATADEKEYYPADSESTVTVSTDTGINGITVDPSSVKIYDLQGRKVNKPTQGVYIVNGKKVVIK